MDKAKYEEAINTIKTGAKVSEYYYHKPMVVAYSGGKDSECVLQLVIESGVDFEVVHSLTTVDAPDTVYHVRKVQKRIREMGKKFEIHHPEMSMWKLIEKEKYPPTRIARYCCEVMKEDSAPNRMVCIGSRKDESRTRSSYKSFHVWGGVAKNAPKFDTEHVKNVLADAIKVTDALDEDENTINAYDCTFIVGAKKNQEITCYPIVEWSEEDVWEFLKERNVPVNPLYEKGFKRVGCVGCPLGGFKSMRKELEMFPKYKENYIKAFDRMIAKRIATGKDQVWKDGKDCLNWWLGLTPIGQESLFDQLDEEGSQYGQVVQNGDKQ